MNFIFPKRHSTVRVNARLGKVRFWVFKAKMCVESSFSYEIRQFKKISINEFFFCFVFHLLASTDFAENPFLFSRLLSLFLLFVKDESKGKTVRCDLEKSSQDFPHLDVQSGLKQHLQPLLFPLKKKKTKEIPKRIFSQISFLENK